MFLHENDFYMGGWVGRAPSFSSKKIKERGGGPRKTLLCDGVLMFSGTKYIRVILLE